MAPSESSLGCRSKLPLIFHLVINPALSNVPNISLIEIEYCPDLSSKSNRLRR
jgi:hypothetical protein